MFGKLFESLADDRFAQIRDRNGLVNDQHAAGYNPVFGDIIHIHTCFITAHVNLGKVLGQGLHEYPKDLTSIAGCNKFNAGMLHIGSFLKLVKIRIILNENTEFLGLVYCIF